MAREVLIDCGDPAKKMVALREPIGFGGTRVKTTGRSRPRAETRFQVGSTARTGAEEARARLQTEALRQAVAELFGHSKVVRAPREVGRFLNRAEAFVYSLRGVMRMR